MTPDLQLRTLLVLDADGRSVSTREPGAYRAPAFGLIRGYDACAWAVRADVPDDVADELDRLAREEPPVADLEQPPIHADRYLALIDGRVDAGPAYTFPDAIPEPDGAVLVTDPGPLEHYFKDMIDEIDGRSPVLAVLDDGRAVSTCHCARRSDEAAEAGLYTLEAYRGRGFGPRVTAAWALAIRASGRTPLYSTSWTNEASRTVARKLGLSAYASDWSIAD